MKALLLLPLIMLAGYLNQDSTMSNADQPLEVLSFKWSKVRQADTNPAVTNLEPNALPGKSVKGTDEVGRERKEALPAGRRPQDPNLESTEMRSAGLDRIVQESRPAKLIDGFSYRVKMHNLNLKVVTGLIWEYQFKESLSPTNVTRRQFVCPVTVKPNKNIEFRVFTTLGPSNVISVGSLSNKGANLFEESVVINYVKYSDGSFWQRKDWNSEEASRANEALTTRVSGQCLAR